MLYGHPGVCLGIYPTPTLRLLFRLRSYAYLVCSFIRLLLLLTSYRLTDSVHKRVDREEGAADDDADEAGHDNHKDRLDHGGDVVNLLVEFCFIDGGGFAEHFVDLP